jgi:homoaconitase/3-isopropylmalate dehydratase large subunit
MDDDTVNVMRAAMALHGLSGSQIDVITRAARDIQRKRSGSKFIEILDDYYERVDRGERVKLANLAREANVNHASLRQAKVRYDAQYRKGKLNGMRNANDQP